MIGVSETAEERVTKLEQAYQEVCARYGRFLEVIAKIDEEEDSLPLGHGGTASLLREHLRMTESMAAAMVNEARGL